MLIDKRPIYEPDQITELGKMLLRVYPELQNGDVALIAISNQEIAYFLLGPRKRPCHWKNVEVLPTSLNEVGETQFSIKLSDEPWFFPQKKRKLLSEQKRIRKVQYALLELMDAKKACCEHKMKVAAAKAERWLARIELGPSFLSNNIRGNLLSFLSVAIRYLRQFDRELKNDIRANRRSSHKEPMLNRWLEALAVRWEQIGLIVDEGRNFADFAILCSPTNVAPIPSVTRDGIREFVQRRQTWHGAWRVRQG